MNANLMAACTTLSFLPCMMSSFSSGPLSISALRPLLGFFSVQHKKKKNTFMQHLQEMYKMRTDTNFKIKVREMEGVESEVVVY